MAKQKTTTKKTATSAKKQTSQAAPPTKWQFSSHTTNLVMGVVIVFISLLGLVQGGAIGILVANGVRLLVGETYSLLLGILLIAGIYLVLKGRMYEPKWTSLLGGSLILVALTTLLHFNQFSVQEPLSQNIFVTTFNTFKNELLLGQMKISLGGGMLGAIFYALFGYLFGKWGTYLFVALVFIAGFSLLFEISASTWVHVFGRVGKIGGSAAQRLFPKREINSTLQDWQDDEGSWQEEAADSQPSEKPIKWNLAERLFGFEAVDEVEEEPQDQLPINKPVAPIVKRPSVVNQLETMETNEPEVLDLDYFNSLEASEPATFEPTVPIIAVQNVYSESEVVENVSEPIEPMVESNHSAGHWQAQAHQTQKLTQDELAQVLAHEQEEQVAAVEPIKSAHKIKRPYQLPGKDLLKKIPPVDQSEEYARINENIEKLERTFESFGVQAKVVQANLGPSVTKYEIQPAIGVKVSKIVSLSDDIALALAARDVRMEAPIPGKSLIGIEVPNTQVSPVSFWEIIDAALETPNILEVPLGRDISGVVCLADLSKMPHLLMAGATGAGKSVGMNVIITSLLMKAKPDEVKFLMIDPKKVELTMYDGIPHLLAPVVTNPRKAAQALNKVVQEMERRYELFAATGVRNIDGYNDNIDQYNAENGTGYERMPKIVVFIDELADLMMVASNDVENAIIRLAQMARAAGIHMIIATQRPSVDVITGIIKANVPSRLAFAVSSSIDSRTILDSNGAEKLLGRGDMLFQPMGKNKPVRVQGAYISDGEVDKITQFVKAQQAAEYDEMMMISEEESGAGANSSDDEYFGEAVELLRGLETISISQLQRKFRIGYNRAARLIDDLEAQGYVGPQDGSKPRQVFVSEMD